MGIRIANRHLPPVILLLLVFVSSFAHASAGKVIFTSGAAFLAPEQPLKRGMPVNQGDEIITGQDGRVQLLMQDGDRIAIRPNTRFQIEVFETLEEQANGPGLQPDGKRLYKVLEGGFRTLTGKAWKRSDDNYQVKTPVATIGIRGTDYELLLLKALESVSGFGLYVAVHSGAVWVRNNVMSTDVYDDEYLYIESKDDPGTKLIAPPDILSGKSKAIDSFWKGAEHSGIESTSGTYESRRSPDEEVGGMGDVDPDPPPDPEIPIIAVSPSGQPVNLTSGVLPNTNQRYVAFSGGPVGSQQGFSGSGLSDEVAMAFDAQGDLEAYPGLYPAAGGPALAVYGLGTSSNVNGGFDPTSGLRWGRWTGGTAIATTANGTENINLNGQSLHWIVSESQTGGTVLPISGQYLYSLVGNTDPTDNLGNVGFLNGSSSMIADFTNQTIDAFIDLSINGQQWTGSDTNGSFGQNGTFAGQFDSVTVNGGNCGGGCAGSGGYSGFFTGGSTAGPPPGAGMGYNMEQGGTSVSGAAAFGDPQSPQSFE